MHVKDLCNALVSRGNDVHVFLGGGGNFEEILRNSDVTVRKCALLGRDLDPIRDTLALRELTRELARIRLDLVSLHSSKAGILGRIASRSIGLPCVFTAHGWAFTEGVASIRRRIYSLIERGMAYLANKIITVSRYDHNLALDIGIPEKRMTQIHNGIAAGNAIVWPQGGNSQSPRAIMVARFGVPKDQIALLRALKFVAHLELDFVGEGPTLEAARAEASALGLNDRVRFLGYRNDATECLRAADIFCLISNYEGFPYTTLEAMREGLPTLVSDVGGAGEAVVEGQTGFLIPRGNVDVLAQRLALLANSPQLRMRMGAAAREHFLANFTFDRMFNRTLAVYKEVLSGRN
jgi:glycosyltransferase involved in cell wall biosynthesis